MVSTVEERQEVSHGDDLRNALECFGCTPIAKAQNKRGVGDSVVECKNWELEILVKVRIGEVTRATTAGESGRQGPPAQPWTEG